MTAQPGSRQHELAPRIALAHSYVTALAVRDPDSLRAVFAPEIDFRGLTPGMV